MKKKIYTVEESGSTKIKQLRNKLADGYRPTLPPRDSLTEETLFEPPPLPGKLYWAKTFDGKLYGLFCTDSVETEDGQKAVDTVLGIWQDPDLSDDRAILEYIAKCWKTVRWNVEHGGKMPYDEDWRRAAKEKR